MYYTYADRVLGKCCIDTLGSCVLNQFADDLLHSGGSSGQALSPRTVQAVMILLRSVLRYGEEEYGLANAASGRIPLWLSWSTPSTFSR